jgi:O-antigen ligase
MMFLLFLVLIALAYLLLRFPEIAFMLFINAGVYKADPRLEILVSYEYFDFTVFFGALCLAGIIIGYSRRRTVLVSPPTRMLLPFASLASLAIISLAYTSAPIYGTDKLIRFLILTSFSFFAPLYLCQSYRRFERFFYAYVAMALCMVFDMLAGGIDPTEVIFRSAFGGSSGYQGLGIITSQSVLILSFMFLLSMEGWRDKIMPILLVVLCLFGTLVSGARTSALVLVVVGGSLLIYKIVRLAFRIGATARIRRSDFRLYTGVAGLTAILAVLGVWVYKEEYFVTFFVRLVLTAESASERGEFAVGALKAISAYPFGLGIGGFSTYFFGEDARGGFPHNIFLEVGSELGWIGLAGFALLCYWTFRTGLSALGTARGRMVHLGTTLLCLFGFALIYFQFHGDFNDARSLFAWAGSIYGFNTLVRAGDDCSAGL